MTTVVLVQQGGTGSNNASDARSALGAAPSAAYDIANSAYTQANGAYAAANTGSSSATDAYNQANAAYAQANTARSDANTTFSTINTTFGTVNTNIGNAYSQANLAYAAANNSNLKSGGLITGTLNVTNDMIVGGNIYLQGNTTYINVSTFNVNDPLIYLAANNDLTDSVDIGFMGGKNTSGTYSHTGLARDATDGKWKLFDGLADEGHIGNVIDFANTSLATLVANVQANVVAIGISSPSIPLQIGKGGGGNPVTSGTTQTYGIARIGSSGTAALDIGTYAAGQVWMQGVNVTNLASNFDMVLQPNGGNVGIGTASPGEIFSIYKASNPAIRLESTAGNMYIVNRTSSTTMEIFNAANGPLWFGTNNAERMRITSAGNVGIGTNNPGYTLVVGGNANSSLVSQVYNANTGASALAITQLNCGGRYVNQQVNYLNQYYQESQDGITTKYTDFNTQIFRNGAGTEAMRITNGGDVGIGTASPARKLTVHTTSEWPILLRGASDTTTNRMSAILMQRARGSLASPTVPTSGTNLGGLEIGGWNTSTYTEGYNGGAAIFAFADGTWTSTSNPTYLSFYTNASGAAGATERVRISAAGGFSVGTSADPGAGAIYATGDITAFYSDDRLKTKLGNIDNALSKVLSLNGFYFEPNETAINFGYEKKKQVGVSAQELKVVLPEVVVPAPIDEEYMTVHYHKIVPLLIEAIKELNDKIDKLTK